MALTSPALDLIVAVLRSGPPLRLAMLFGSTAKGTQRIDSDIDIGIVPEDPELSLAEELTLQTDLARVSGRQVDLVRLDRASTLLRLAGGALRAGAGRDDAIRGGAVHGGNRRGIP